MKNRTIPVLEAYKFARLVERRQKIETQLQLMQSQTNQLQMQMADTNKESAALIEKVGLKGLDFGSVILEDTDGLVAGTVLDPKGQPMPLPEEPAPPALALVPPVEPPAT